MSARNRSGERYPPASDPSPPASLTAATNAGVLGPPPIGADTIGSRIPSRRTASVSHSPAIRSPRSVADALRTFGDGYRENHRGPEPGGEERVGDPLAD